MERKEIEEVYVKKINKFLNILDKRSFYQNI